MKKVAVILSGCGVYDGSEIHEACAALLALHRAGAEVQVCAPAGPQMHVVDHLAGEPAEGQQRDILVEAARLARGEIKPLGEIDPAAFDAVVLPGGFGAAKNLCTFAVDGDACAVNPEVAMCIAPVILARVFGPELSPAVTIGNDAATAELVNKMGARHIDCAADQCVVDEPNNMVTTPAYMLAGDIGQVFDGAAVFVDKLLGLCH